jgi:mRNA-degrading endonuclease RelE of RelBE toxin-antitoxin system
MQFGFHPRAAKQASKLPTDVDNKIQSKLKEMVTNDWRDLFDYDVDTIAGTTHDIYRTRIGDHRVFFVIFQDKCAILHIDDREGAYGNPDTLERRATDFLQ